MKIIFLILLMWVLPPLLTQGSSEPKKKIRVAYVVDPSVSGVNVNDAKAALEVLFNGLLNKKLPGYTYETVMFWDIDTAVTAFNAGNIDVMSMTSLDYLTTRDKMNLLPTFVSTSGGKPEDDYLLLVRKEMHLKTIEQLKNKSLIVESGDIGEIALMWLNILLMEKSLEEADTFFNDIKRVSKVSQAVLPVFFKQADVCIVRRFFYETIVALNPQVGKELMVLMKSPPFLYAIGSVRAGLDKQVIDNMKNLSRTLEQEPEGRQILLLYHIDKIMEYKPEYLENLENLYNRYMLLKERNEQHP